MSDDEDMDVDEEVVIPELQKRSHHRTVKTGETLFIPPDIMGLKGVVSCATRNKISHTALASLFSTIISYCGGDINKFNLHASTGNKYQVAAQESIADIIMEEWEPPTVATVQWDEKALSELDNKYKKVERIPVLVSGAR